MKQRPRPLTTATKGLISAQDQVGKIILKCICIKFAFASFSGWVGCYFGRREGNEVAGGAATGNVAASFGHSWTMLKKNKYITFIHLF